MRLKTLTLALAFITAAGYITWSSFISRMFMKFIISNEMKVAVSPTGLYEMLDRNSVDNMIDNYVERIIDRDQVLLMAELNLFFPLHTPLGLH